MSNLNACYDLERSPPTYDFVGFLLAAEMERLRLGHDTLTIDILPGPDGGFRRDGLPPYTVEERRVMRDRIVEPMAWHLPNCKRVTVRDKRIAEDELTFGFEQARYGFGPMLKAANAGLYPFRAALEPEHIQGRYTTVTLREATYHPERNSNLAEWIKTVRWLRNRGKRVIVVRDTEHADEALEDFETDPAASRCLYARAALYANAELNLFVNNGPAWLCLFLGVPCMIFGMIQKHAPGWPEGSLWPNAQRRQLVSWQTGHSENVIAAIECAS